MSYFAPFQRRPSQPGAGMAQGRPLASPWAVSSGPSAFLQRRPLFPPTAPRGQVQAKLSVSRPGDALEQEADRIADRLVGGGAAPMSSSAGIAAGVQRKCAACEEEDQIQKKAVAGGGAPARPAASADVAAVVSQRGQPLAPQTRAFFERGLGHDFSGVRVHADASAFASTRNLEARAYTLGNHVVFGADQYAPDTADGRRLLGHELVHVVQQADGHRGDQTGDDARNETIQRACLSGATCASPPGSATEFGTGVQSREAAARARRSAMAPARQLATGHTGRARQLETFLNSQAPGLLANIHGIFIDQDMDPHVAASTQDCSSMVPPITGATKPCVFVPGAVNQQALRFNTDPLAATIGGQSREDWRIGTVQTLVHEIQHVQYDTAVSPRALPGGVTTCARADVDHELSELNAIISEFPSVFDAVPVGAAAGDPARVRLASWFTHSITNPGESIRGILTTIRCKCSCPDTDVFIKETFDFVTAAWPAARRDAFNVELRKSVWGLTWPL